jgi:hypothetical protein
MIALRAAANERKQTTAERRSALAHALFFKMIQICSHLHHFNSHLKTSLAPMKKEDVGAAAWAVVLPFANMPDYVRLSADEMALLLSLDNDVFNTVVSFDEIHNSTIDAFKTYSERRLALTAMLPAETNSDVGTTALNPEQWALVSPRMAELNGLIGQLAPQCEKDEREAWAGLVSLQKILNSKLGLTLRVVPKESSSIPDLRPTK